MSVYTLFVNHVHIYYRLSRSPACAGSRARAALIVLTVRSIQPARYCNRYGLSSGAGIGAHRRLLQLLCAVPRSRIPLSRLSRPVPSWPPPGRTHIRLSHRSLPCATAADTPLETPTSICWAIDLHAQASSAWSVATHMCLTRRRAQNLELRHYHDLEPALLHVLYLVRERTMKGLAIRTDSNTWQG